MWVRIGFGFIRIEAKDWKGLKVGRIDFGLMQIKDAD